MPNETSLKRNLTVDEQRRLFLIVTEMKARGVPIPSGLELQTTASSMNWNMDENGYFIKSDGKRFSPRPVLVDFINDPSRFILLKSGRGGGKTTGGAQKGLLKIKAGKSGAVMNPDFENFRTSTWPELRE